MRYIVVGAGGIGGALGAHLKAGGKDVALIARGEHLAAIRQKGLTLKRPDKEDLCLRDIEAHDAPEDFAPADAVFVCVKGYSLAEAMPVICRAARPGAVVIPLLNTLTAGQKLSAALPGRAALDGCIYTSAFIAAPGIISQPSPLFRIIFGARLEQKADAALLKKVEAGLESCGIRAVLSPCIERDAFRKFAFISAFAAADSYLDISAAALQRQGPPRELFLALLREITALGAALKLDFGSDLFADTLAFTDKLDMDITSSMHKDVAAGRPSEKQELIFDVVEMAAKLRVAVPNYIKIARHFGMQDNMNEM